MNQEDLINFLKNRIEELKIIKSKIGDTGSRSSEIAIEWIDGLIKTNENFLKRIYH